MHVNDHRSERAAMRFLGLTLAQPSLGHLIDTLDAWSRASTHHRIHMATPRLLLEASSNPRFLHMMQSADLILIANRALSTAVGLCLRTRLKAYPEERWLPPFLARLAEHGGRIFYAGGPRGAADTWAATIMQRYPGVEARGRDGHFEKWGPENDRFLSEVNTFQPHVVFIGFGSPYQDEYAAAHLALLHAPLVVTLDAWAERSTGIRFEGPVRAGRLRHIGRHLRLPRHMVDACALARVVEVGVRKRTDGGD